MEKSSSESDERLGEAIADYLRIAEKGTPPDRATFLGQHPDLTSELEIFFANHDDAERRSRPLRELTLSGQETWKGDTFGKYQILGEIARGGMGVVYKAFDPDLERNVALKMIRAGHLATEEDLERFHIEAKAAASLSHPNIVRVHDFGEHKGQAYFTMELIQGDTLNRHDCDFTSDFREAGRLLALVARAIHHAHQRGIIHRDLKPANILIDAAGEPHVTDFGLAMHLEGRERLTDSNILLGTLPYMAPERLSDKVQPLTTSVDIWSLGVILYEILTGRQPFHGNNQIDEQDKIRGGDPLPVHDLNRRVQKDLGAICQKCLEKDPRARYGSAEALAEDLERWLRGEPPRARVIGPLPRLGRWCRRKPALAGVIVASFLLFLILTMTPFVVAASKSARRREILETNVYMAQGAASQIQLQLKSYGGPVLGAGDRPELAELLLKKDLTGLADFLERMRKTYPTPKFESWLIVDLDGTMLARSPDNNAVGRKVGVRDYFRGTRQHHLASPDERGVHLSLVYQSVAEPHQVHYALCVPILDRTKGYVGVLAATLSTDDSLGLPNLQDPRRKATLVGPFDPGRIEGDLPGSTPEWLMLVHEGMKPGDSALPVRDPVLKELGGRRCPRELSNPDSRRLSYQDAGYEDPYRERDADYSGRWLAGYAPVGNTGFVVIVQQREE